MDNELEMIKAEAEPKQGFANGFDIIKITKGDTVVVRVDAPDQEQCMAITQVFATLFAERGLGPEDVSLLILPANLDVKILNEDQMQAQGWRRSTRIKIATPGNLGNIGNGFHRK